MKRQMKQRGLWFAAMMAVPLLPAAVRAGDADVLKVVPQDAWAVLIVRNLGQLDQKLMGLAQQLNVEPMSMLSMAKAAMGLQAGVSDNGSAAMIFAPGQMGMGAMGEAWKYLAILVPTQDYAGLIGGLGPEDVGEGVSKVTLAAQPAFVVQHGTFAVVGPTPEATKAVLAAASGPGIAAVFSPHQLERYSQDDLTLLVNLKTIFGDPGVSGMLAGMMAMSGQQVTPQQLQEYEAFAVSLRIEKDGVRLGFFGGFKEGSEAAQTWTSAPAKTETMLTGLPGERYALAFGTISDATGSALMAEGYKKSLEAQMNMLPPEVDRAKLTEGLNTWVGMLRDMRLLSVCVSALPQGSDGLFGASKVVGFESGAADKCARVGEIIQTIAAAVPMPQVQKALQHVRFTSNAETLDGISVHQLHIALDQMEGMTPEQFAKVKAVVGSEGLIVRLGAVDDRLMAVSMGGGAARMQKLIELMKASAAPLSADEGIKQTAAMLPASRYFEGYLAADTTLNLVSEIAKAVGEEAVPFTVPAVNSPLGMVMAPVGKTGVQADIAVPMAVVVAAKNVAATYRGAGATGDVGTSGAPDAGGD